MKKRSYLFFVAGMALAIPALVVAPRSAESRQEKHIPSQPELNEMAYKNWQKADSELNRAYKKLLPLLDATGGAKLKKAQRAWVAYRDAEAESNADEMRGGQAEQMLRYGTKEQLTKERTANFNRKIKLLQ